MRYLIPQLTRVILENVGLRKSVVCGFCEAFELRKRAGCVVQKLNLQACTSLYGDDLDNFEEGVRHVAWNGCIDF